MAIRPEQPKARPLVGIAFDIGTTTIAGCSVDLSGSLPAPPLEFASISNPQARWGADVITRINAVTSDPGALTPMSVSVVDACNSIIKGLSRGADIKEITAAGNTAMEHILLNVSPAPLSKPPYKPAFKAARRLPARDIGFNAGPDTLLYTFPIIGGFVGGDAVAVALHLGLHKSRKNVLAIDIGTNSEILLCAKGAIYATSAAAGPAFEGGGIEKGMTAGKGAIQSVKVVEDEIKLGVIGGVTPRGICGSGLVDAARTLLNAGIIEPSGRIKGRDEVLTNLSNRIKEGPEGNSFVLHKGALGEICLSQKDVRALQVAKSAIRAGISVLLKKAGIKDADIEGICVAGAFGSNLNEEGLKTIGLIDSKWTRNLTFAGDAALFGAALAVGSQEAKEEAERISEQARYVPLSGSCHFEREFIKNMDF